MSRVQTTSAFACAVVSATAALWACGHQNPPSNAPTATAPNGAMGVTMAQPTAQAPPATPSPALFSAEPTYGPQSPMVPGGWGLPPDLTGLDDRQLAGVVQAIDEADIEHLQLALNRSSSEIVLSFARDGIQALRAAASQDDRDFARLSLIPSVSNISQEVLSDWQRDRSELQALPPRDFDRAFLDDHVTRDARALSLLDAAIDRAKGSELRARLQRDRTTLAEHLREAQHVQTMVRSRAR